MQPLPTPIPTSRSRCPAAPFLSISGLFTNQDCPPARFCVFVAFKPALGHSGRGEGRVFALCHPAISSTKWCVTAAHTLESSGDCRRTEDCCSRSSPRPARHRERGVVRRGTSRKQMLRRRKSSERHHGDRRAQLVHSFSRLTPVLIGEGAGDREKGAAGQRDRLIGMGVGIGCINSQRRSCLVWVWGPR